MDWSTIAFALIVMGALGAAFGVVLSIADKRFAVEEDSRAAAVREALAGANCGACGYAGCDAFAEAVVRGEAPVTGCFPAGAKGAQAIADIMGVSIVQEEEQAARVACQGFCGVAKERYKYEGLQSCALAATLAGGPKQCTSACLGMGDCMQACPFGAIEIENDVAKVYSAKCVACGKCVEACPRGLIHILPADDVVFVACQNHDAPKVARSSCDNACISCGRCIKVCTCDAIEIVDNCAVIDQDKCSRCGTCVAVCPDHCIRDVTGLPA